MIEDDVQLIHRILSGDNEAFTALVRKYQKLVHALAWRKIGDFHYAEEITQDVFVVLLLGASNQYLVRFQKPYSFEAASEPTVEIIEASIVLETNAKPAVRSQAGRAAAGSERSGTASQTAEAVSTPDALVSSELPIQARIQNRSFPSIFKAWSRISNRPALSDEARFAHHDLSWSPEFRFRFQRTDQGFQLSGDLVEIRKRRDTLIEMNPHKISFLRFR